MALLLVGLLVVVGAAYYSWYAAKKRREAFAALAAAKGWTYVERDDRWVEAFEDSPFGTGHRRSAKNVVSGSFDQRPFVSFDYTYYTTEVSSNGKTTTTREVAHPFGVVALDIGVALPALSVEPEGMFGRMIGRLTGHDIELESEEFNRAFTVHCPDRKFASDVLHPAAMEFLMLHRGTSFRFDGRYALTVESGTVPIETVEPRLGYLDQLLDTVPEFVWQDVRGGGGPPAV